MQVCVCVYMYKGFSQWEASIFFGKMVCVCIAVGLCCMGINAEVTVFQTRWLGVVECDMEYVFFLKHIHMYECVLSEEDECESHNMEESESERQWARQNEESYECIRTAHRYVLKRKSSSHIFWIYIYLLFIHVYDYVYKLILKLINTYTCTGTRTRQRESHIFQIYTHSSTHMLINRYPYA